MSKCEHCGAHDHEHEHEEEEENLKAEVVKLVIALIIFEIAFFKSYTVPPRSFADSG